MRRKISAISFERPPITSGTTDHTDDTDTTGGAIRSLRSQRGCRRNQNVTRSRGERGDTKTRPRSTDFWKTVPRNATKKSLSRRAGTKKSTDCGPEWGLRVVLGYEPRRRGCMDVLTPTHLPADQMAAESMMSCQSEMYISLCARTR